MADIRIDAPSTLSWNHVAQWFGTLMFEAAEACGIKITEARIRVYAADLADLEPAQVIAAFRRVRREGSGFFPSISEVRRQVMASPDDAALLAWTAFERAASEVGGYETLEVEDLCAAHALVAVFGSWAAYCETETGPELGTKRQAFMAAYREGRRAQAALQDRLAPGALHAGAADVARLPGLCESGGTYRRKTSIWTARLTAGGAIVHQRETPELPDAPSVNQLTSGSDSDTR